MITQDNLKEYLYYKEGKLFWKKQPSSVIPVGSEAGNVNARGYIQIKIFNKRFYAHRLVYFMFNGYFPKEIDHIDGDKSNNKIENLRCVTKSQNGWNTKKRKDNSSGVKNIYWDKRTTSWMVSFQVNKIKKYYGRFKNKDEAIIMANKMRNHLHGEYANHGD